MLMGNITVTAIWKYFADRTHSPEILSFAQKLVTYTDWSMTVWGVLLLMGGGYAMVFLVNWPLTQWWLLWSQILFVVAGLIWLFILVPIQIKHEGVMFVCDECLCQYAVVCKRRPFSHKGENNFDIELRRRTNLLLLMAL